MTDMQLVHPRLLIRKTVHTLAYTVYTTAQEFLIKKGTTISLNLPAAAIPEELAELLHTNITYPFIELNRIMPKRWYIRLVGGQIFFITKLSLSCNNFKMNVLLRMSKSLLGSGSEVPDNYDDLCRAKFEALKN